MTQRFNAYIHSIVGHQVMVSPNGQAGEQYKCALDDFESIMPVSSTDSLFAFHVKRDRIGIDHYRQWLGLKKAENDRLENIEKGLLALINSGTPKPPTPEDFAANFFDPTKVA